MNAARACILALLLCWAFAALADVAVPPLVGRVVDQTGTLSSDEIASLNQTLRNLEARKGSQVAVLIVPTTAPEAIEQYSLRVAETWKIGRKNIDDGALLGLALDPKCRCLALEDGAEASVTKANGAVGRRQHRQQLVGAARAEADHNPSPQMSVRGRDA